MEEVSLYPSCVFLLFPTQLVVATLKDTVVGQVGCQSDHLHSHAERELQQRVLWLRD